MNQPGEEFIRKPFRLGRGEKREHNKVYHNENEFRKWQENKADFIQEQVKATSLKVRNSRAHLSQSVVSRLKNEIRNSELTITVG